jgi:hypothetical protein
LLAAAGFFYCLFGTLFLHNLYYQTQTIFGLARRTPPCWTSLPLGVTHALTLFLLKAMIVVLLSVADSN